MDTTPRRPGLGELADRYLRALLQARRREACAMILDALDAGELGVRELYLSVFAPVLTEVGRRWEHNEITIAQEHFISASTQLLMSQLYPRIFATARRGRTMIAACAGAELHEIGLRMVADFFELDGWDTYYLGANLPVAAVLDAVRERDADLLALSATMPPHVRCVREAIAALRADPARRETRVIVGGGAFRGPPEAWQAIGADGFAADAATAVSLGRELLSSAPERQ